MGFPWPPLKPSWEPGNLQVGKGWEYAVGEFLYPIYSLPWGPWLAKVF